MNIPLRYGEPLLKISSVQALLRISFVCWVWISLIHWWIRLFQIDSHRCLVWAAYAVLFTHSFHITLIHPDFHLFFLFSLIHCPCHLFTWRFPPIQRCLSLIQMNNMIISWFFTFPLFIRSKTYSYRAPKSHLVLKILTRMEWLFLQGLFSLVTNLPRKLLYT